METARIAPSAQIIDYPLRLSLEDLLAAVDSAHPAGQPLYDTEVYSLIEEGRRHDDPNLPMGMWERQLKKADWDLVSDTAAKALAHRSKDLQLAAWLMEAELHLHGLRSLSYSFQLLRGLCERYWGAMYPQGDGDDLEHRLNIFRWIDKKLLPTIRMLPLIHGHRKEEQYRWADWEQALRNEQLMLVDNGAYSEEVEGATLQVFNAALQSTSSQSLSGLMHDLQDTQDNISALNQVLDELCGEDAPGMTGITGLLEEITALIGSELHKRGALHEEPPSVVDMPMDDGPNAPAGEESDFVGPVQDRAAAYMRLNEAADFLMYVEPHSPVPYLIRKAIEWGGLNTAELYEQLFIQQQGQLNIFDLLGINPNQGGHEPQ